MADQIPDWLRSPRGGSDAEAERALGLLRKLVRNDAIEHGDWVRALQEVAATAREALDASSAFLAIFRPSQQAWTAVTSEGHALSHDDISLHGSRTVLERIRSTGKPLVSAIGGSLDVDSDSLRRQQVESVMALPILFWDLERTQSLAGCLYVHRTTGRPQFVEGDIEAGTDIVRAAEPRLNLLRLILRHGSAMARAGSAAITESGTLVRRIGAFSSRNLSCIEHVLEPLARGVESGAPRILIQGPPGSGKSYLARACHDAGARAGRPFVSVDCRKAFDREGAVRLAEELLPGPEGPGRIVEAHGGTLHLEEVGRLPMDLQRRLLRVTQQGLLEAPGGSPEVPADVHLVAETTEDLERLVQGFRFREDFLWRLREISVRLPPLSGRLEDIPELAAELLARISLDADRQEIAGFDAPAMELLLAHAWSECGNVLGLEETISRAVVNAPEGMTRLDVAVIKGSLPARLTK